jgi:molybdenum cofactor guanylyltransferase
MGGREKGLLALAGRPLVAHVARVLAPHCGTVWVAARDGAPYRRLGFQTVEDGTRAGAGPLAGIRAALAVSRARALVIAPCDAPFLPADFAPRLLDALRSAPAVYADDGVRAHYACAALDTALAPVVEDFLIRGGRALHAFHAEVGARAVAFAVPAAFRNLNTPADLAAAQHEPAPA